MAYVDEESVWKEGVYMLEVTDRVLGGPDGVSNQPSKDLASRTRYLYDQLIGVWRIIRGRDIAEFTSVATTAGTQLTLPLEYEVGGKNMLLFTEATGLISNAYYNEVGTTGALSNVITLTFDLPANILVTQVILDGGSSTITGIPDELINQLQTAISRANAASAYIEEYVEDNPVFTPDEEAAGISSMSISAAGSAAVGLSQSVSGITISSVTAESETPKSESAEDTSAE